VKKSLHTTEQKILLELLYQLRVSSGLTQKELAILLEAPQSFISKIESGERRMDIIELRWLLTKLNINLPDFVTEFEKRIHES
jgi:transcriptional regulator with XRE-family HTH domain